MSLTARVCRGKIPALSDTPGVAPWTREPCNQVGARVDARANSWAAGSDIARAATAAGGDETCVLEHRADLAGLAAFPSRRVPPMLWKRQWQRPSLRSPLQNAVAWFRHRGCSLR